VALQNNLIEAFLEYMIAARGMSLNTVSAYEAALKDFSCYAPEVEKINAMVVRQYMSCLNDRGLSARTQAHRLTVLRSFFRYLMEQELVSEDPTLHVVSPKLPQSLPKALSTADMRKLLHVCDSETPADLRLRAILETLYATGMRISELAQMTIFDIDEGEGYTLRVTGKGGKTRLVPLGEHAFSTLVKYIMRGRPRYEKEGNNWLFPGRGTDAMTRQRLFQLVKEAGKKAGVEISPHSLRHTFATHLVQNDADLRSVQLMLGHADLATTQVYTKVARDRMRQVLEQNHPLNRNK